MCRLFGFRSIFNSHVHTSLVGANNALMNQSKIHPDGWGVAYYVYNNPHLIKSPNAAIDDHLFEKVSGIVSSKTVLAHIRTATEGNNNILNCHPFQFGHWVFAHNGNIKNFKEIKPQLLNRIDASYLRYLLGDTDSEVLFYYLLSHFDKLIKDPKKVSFSEIQLTSQKVIDELIDLTGPLCTTEGSPNTENFLTFVLTNGHNMMAFNGGQPLYYSTHKTRCPERETCEHFTEACENKVNSGVINHFIVASEPLNTENVWIKTNPGTLLYVDFEMGFHKAKLTIKQSY
ncbi:MAG: class II glutamine amidotransferase [Halobacteriovoraceae bacterium]|nr:class II glutamine amidotransferase [Halobacteriovoraceae bacterium]MCB9095508.1 class II glutamine amidotransferase [Halobacteriovoraceae bacterium]